MATEILLWQFFAATVLFFFWAYGVVSFLLDLKNKIIPGIRQYRRGRKKLDREESQQSEREEKEKQLY